MIISQAFNSVLLPATVACIFLLGNNKSVMKEHKHSTRTNAILIAIFLFSIVTSFMGIKGVFAMING